MKRGFYPNCLRLVLAGALLLIVMAVTHLPGDGQAVVEGARPVAPRSVTFLYLPLLHKPMAGISGRVTFNGQLVGGVPLQLRFYNGSSYSTSATTATSSDGAYSFTGVPSLGSGQRYFVQFLNSTSGSNTQLWYWATRALTSYSAGDSVRIGDFDIANIPLVSPNSGATVALPYMFQWSTRPATNSDSYEFDLQGSSGSPYWYTDPPLGYTGSYTLRSLPTGFNPGVQYDWYAMVTNPDGGWGLSYYYRVVTFSNSGRSISVSEPRVPARDPEFIHPGLQD